jgi:hypothetical protein
MLWRAPSPAVRHVVAHHLPDRLRADPVDVTFMCAGLQCQPFLTRLASRPRLHARAVVLDRHTAAAVGVGTATGRNARIVA